MQRQCDTCGGDKALRFGPGGVRVPLVDVNLSAGPAKEPPGSGGGGPLAAERRAKLLADAWRIELLMASYEAEAADHEARAALDGDASRADAARELARLLQAQAAALSGQKAARLKAAAAW